MTSYASIPDQRVVELAERGHRQRRLATILVQEGDLRDPRIAERVRRHGVSAAEYERQARGLQVPT